MRQLWQCWPGAATASTLSWLECRAAPLPDAVGLVSTEGLASPEHRRSRVRNMSHDLAVRDWLWQYVQVANELAFQVDVGNDAELQHTEYLSSDTGHYDWHHDVFWTSDSPTDRKLSVVVQLSDPSDCEGGQLEFSGVGGPPVWSRGSIIVFPSTLPHRVRPVTRGRRRTLVGWFYGPRWR